MSCIFPYMTHCITHNHITGYSFLITANFTFSPFMFHFLLYTPQGPSPSFTSFAKISSRSVVCFSLLFLQFIIITIEKLNSVFNFKIRFFPHCLNLAYHFSTKPFNKFRCKICIIYCNTIITCRWKPLSVLPHKYIGFFKLDSFFINFKYKVSPFLNLSTASNHQLHLKLFLFGVQVSKFGSYCL